MDWDNPRDINEKMQWLICYGDTSQWPRLADKYRVRGFIKEKGYEDAMGKIKWFMLSYSIFFILSLPIGFILLKMGYPAVTMLILFVFIDIVCRLTQLALMKIIYDFDVISFCKKAYTRPFIIVALMALYFICYSHFPMNTMLAHVVGLLSTGLVGLVMVCSIGFTVSEKRKLLEYVKRMLVR